MTELLRIGFSLVVVVVLIILAARLFQSRMYQSGAAFLKTLGYLSLGPRRGIAVVKAGKEILLVGVTPTDIKLLKSIEEEQFSSDMDVLKSNVEHVRTLKDLFKKNWISRNTIGGNE